jgi:hypothetical protein
MGLRFKGSRVPQGEDEAPGMEEEMEPREKTGPRRIWD